MGDLHPTYDSIIPGYKSTESIYISYFCTQTGWIYANYLPTAKLAPSRQILLPVHFALCNERYSKLQNTNIRVSHFIRDGYTMRALMMMLSVVASSVALKYDIIQYPHIRFYRA